MNVEQVRKQLHEELDLQLDYLVKKAKNPCIMDLLLSFNDCPWEKWTLYHEGDPNGEVSDALWEGRMVQVNSEWCLLIDGSFLHEARELRVIKTGEQGEFERRQDLS
jgi:hypothetical protein